MYIVSADPGATGAIVRVVKDPAIGGIFDFWKMPQGDGVLLKLLREEVCGPDVEGQAGFAYLEQVGGHFWRPGMTPPEMMKTLQRIKANLDLREDMGAIRMSFVAVGLSTKGTVTPVKWQNFIAKERPKGQENSAARKKLIHSRVLEQVSPAQYGRTIKKGIPLYAADAFALALYCMSACVEWRG